MSTVRSIERRLYVRRQMDRDMASRVGVVGAEIPRHMEWNGIWAGYMTFAGVSILLLALVFGIGFSSLNPLAASSWAGVGAGTAVWGVIVALIATFIGSWIAGRTPRTSRRHGMMRGVTLWGMIMVTTLLLVGWVAGTAVATGATLAGNAMTPSTGVSAVQGVLQNSGLTVTDAQATTISTELAAGDKTGAANTLAAAANIAPERANTIVNQIASPVAGAASTAGSVVQHGGASLSWGLFWLALIGLGCALLGGAIGGGGVEFVRRTVPVSRSAA